MHRIFQESADPVVFRKFLDELNELYSTDKQFLFKGKHYRVSHLSIQRWILAQPMSGQSLCLRNMLLDAMMSAASKCPGSEIWIPFLLRNNLDNRSVTRRSSKDYIRSTMSLTKNTRAKNIFKALTDTCGPTTRIQVKPTKSHDDIIKYRNCFQFPLKLDPIFHQMIGHKETIEMYSPKIIIIEGAPESVGELNPLLQKCHESGTNVVLVARSFPEEVSATLATNWARNSLNVLPVIYGASIDTINLSADLTAVTQGELITPMMGDVISIGVTQECKQGTCKRILWTSSGLHIYKDINVSKHINGLLERIKNTEEEELQQLYSDRIACLSNDSIELQISDHDPICLEEIDQMIKHYNAFMRSGSCDTNSGLLPKLLVDCATEITETLKTEILKIAGFLVVVDDGDLVS
jgi:hypothetical protein